MIRKLPKSLLQCTADGLIKALPKFTRLCFSLDDADICFSGTKHVCNCVIQQFPFADTFFFMIQCNGHHIERGKLRGGNDKSSTLKTLRRTARLPTPPVWPLLLFPSGSLRSGPPRRPSSAHSKPTRQSGDLHLQIEACLRSAADSGASSTSEGGGAGGAACLIQRLG